MTLSNEDFERISDEIKQYQKAFEKMKKDVRSKVDLADCPGFHKTLEKERLSDLCTKEVFRFLADKAKILAQISDTQLEELSKALQNNPGFTFSRLSKACKVGRKEMPEFVLRNDALTIDMWEGLPERDKQKFWRNDAILVKCRNSYIRVRTSDLTFEQTRMVIDRWNPEQGIKHLGIQRKLRRAWYRS